MALPDLDGEYENQLNLARKLILKIKDKSGETCFYTGLIQAYHKVYTPDFYTFELTHNDRTVALKYVNMLTSLRSDDVTVKRNRNAFFKYFLEVLQNQLNIEAKHTILCTCPIEHEEDLSDPLKYLQKEVLNSGEKITSHWSKDKRSYVSAKIIPGRGALLYMAVSSDPDSEWDIRGTQGKKN